MRLRLRVLAAGDAAAGGGGGGGGGGGARYELLPPGEFAPLYVVAVGKEGEIAPPLLGPQDT